MISKLFLDPRSSIPDPKNLDPRSSILDPLPHVIVLLLTCLLGVSCAPTEEATAAPGEPIPGLDSVQLEAFRDGRALFDRDFTPEQGLGPLFNQRRCSSCHDLPAVGGMGAEFARKATRFEGGRCDLLVKQGGDMFQIRATPLLEAHGIASDPMPVEANAFARISAPPLFGAGLIEAIPENEILKRADPDDRDGDGVSGRPGTALAGGLGRFGRKGTFGTIRSFVIGALAGEMGITTVENMKEEQPGGQPLPAAADPAADPELDSAGVAALSNFVRMLAAPAREVPAAPAARDSIERGAREFERIGCAACHTPVMRTETRTRRVVVRLYSDLLLHDMGPEAASVCAPHALPSEWLTPPLMGLRHRQQFLHDGRAQRVEAAIGAHGGEAQASRDRFESLGIARREELLRFLRSL